MQIELTKKQTKQLEDILHEHKLVKLGCNKKPYAIIKEKQTSTMKRIVWVKNMFGSNWKLDSFRVH